MDNVLIRKIVLRAILVRRIYAHVCYALSTTNKLNVTND